MHKDLLLAMIFAAALVTVTSPVVAGEPVADAAAEQSIAPEAAAGGAVAHDHSETCGSGGSCCAACKMKQKYAKAAAGDEEGECPCKKAKLAREQAEREQAAAQAGAAPAAD